MANTPKFVVVSGLPASGKSTLASAIAAELGLPLIDKDTLLETLFDTIGIGDAAWRKRLSRTADTNLQQMAEASNGAVLVSWWRHPTSPMDSGTETAWLRSLPGPLVELHCRCEPSTAVDRFFARQRHPGHLDREKSRAQALKTFEAFAKLGAIGAGPLIEVCTQEVARVPELVAQIERLAASTHSSRFTAMRP